MTKTNMSNFIFIKTFLNIGQFLYLEATGAKLGDIGVIRTPWFKRTGSLCITFGYHMYGNSMGGLQLYAYEKLQSTNIGNNKFLWGKLRDQGFKWHTQTVTYNPDQEVEVQRVYLLTFTKVWF